MKIDTKFDIGQLIYGVHKEWVYPKLVCPACEDGLAEIRGKRYRCPNCYGKGFVAGKSVFRLVAFEIGRVVSIHLHGGEFGLDVVYTVYHSMYHENRDIVQEECFSTHEEAIAAAAEGNGMVRNDN